MRNWKMISMLAAVSVMAAGCGAGEKTADRQEIVLNVWNYYSGAQQESFQALVDEFNQGRGKELKITINVSSEGSISDLEADVIDAAEKKVGAREVPDIFAAYADTAMNIDEHGIIQDISSYFTKEETEEYVDSYLEEGNLGREGEIKIFPVAKATEIFMLNQTDWDKFSEATGADIQDLRTIEGVTKTAEKYYQWTDSLTPEEDDGKAFFGRDAMANYMFIGARQFGVEIISVDDDGKMILSLPKDVARKLWDNYYVTYIKGYFSAVGKFRSDDVRTGNVICFVGSSASASFFPKEVILSDEESYPIESSVLEAPRFEDGEPFAVQQGAGMVVTKGSDRKVEACVEFLKWFTEPEQNIRFCLASGYLPVKKEANDMDRIMEETEVTESVKKTLEAAVSTVNGNTLYTSPVTRNAGSVRELMNYSMSDLAAADSQEIERMRSEGTSREEAVSMYDTDEHFEEWYAEICRQMEELVK